MANLKGKQKKLDKDGDGKITGKDFKMMKKAKVGKMIDDTEELGRVDAEKAYSKKGKRNLKDEKKRLVKEIKKDKKKMIKANKGKMVSTRGFGAARTSGMGLQDESLQPGQNGGGGGGAGGHRTNFPTPSGLCVSASPGSYPITVGAGGAGSSGGGSTPCQSATKGANGSNSVFSSITSAGGGGGGNGHTNGQASSKNGANGGSVCQSTEPALPNPDCDAPLASDTVSPDAPIVIVVPD